MDISYNHKYAKIAVRTAVCALKIKITVYNVLKIEWISQIAFAKQIQGSI